MAFNMLNFIHSEKGMQEEYEKIKKTEEFMVRINSGCENATKMRYEQLERRKKQLYDEIEARAIELAMTERALGELTKNGK